MPTRGRPDQLSRVVESVRTTADSCPQIVVYADEDDQPTIDRARELLLTLVIGPRIVMSDMWNKCADSALGGILMMAADDMVFKTSGWDTMIENEFAASKDKILMVHGDDGVNAERFSAFPTIHKKWVDTVGYFVPPVFVGDFADTWLFDVANALGRRKFIPYVTEHMHYLFNKSSYDDTYREKREREKENSPMSLYARLSGKRREDVEKLRAVMDGD